MSIRHAQFDRLLDDPECPWALPAGRNVDGEEHLPAIDALSYLQRRLENEPNLERDFMQYVDAVGARTIRSVDVTGILLRPFRTLLRRQSRDRSVVFAFPSSYFATRPRPRELFRTRFEGE